MTAGTFAVSRRIWQHPEFAPSAFSEREAFLWLVSEASWKPRRVRAGDCVVNLQRGQLAASVRFMAAAWKWTPAKVQRFIFRMKKADMIRVETDTGVSVVTLCNYDEYQGSQQSNDTGPIQSRYRADTNENKDEIRVNKGKRDTNVSLELFAPESEPPDRFSEFWDQYPHRNGAKKGKANAQKAWAKAIKARASPQEIIAGAMRYAGDRQVIEGYAKDPATWLNAKGWMDEIEYASTHKPTGSRPSGSGFGVADGFAAVAARIASRAK